MKIRRIQTLFKMEMLKLFRNPMYLVFNVLFAAMLIAIMGFALGNNYGWGPELSIFEHMVPGIFVYAGILTTQQVAISVSADRDMGLQSRISITPTTSSEKLTSQMLAYTVLPIIQTFIMGITAFLVGYRPKVNFAGILLVFVFMILMTFCSVGLGLITAAVSKNSDIAGGIAWIFILPQQMFGSFIYLGESVKSIQKFIPSQYPTEAIYRIFYGVPLSDIIIWKNFLVILVIGIIVYCIGLVLYNKKSKV